MCIVFTKILFEQFTGYCMLCLNGEAFHSSCLLECRQLGGSNMSERTIVKDKTIYFKKKYHDCWVGIVNFKLLAKEDLFIKLKYILNFGTLVRKFVQTCLSGAISVKFCTMRKFVQKLHLILQSFNLKCVHYWKKEAPHH